MKEKYTDTVQNRFTAYLVAAVTNQRIHYMERKKFLKEMEAVQPDILEKKYHDFDEQYHGYIGEQTAFIMEDWERFEDLMVMLESEKLFKAVNRLKEYERKLLLPEFLESLHLQSLKEVRHEAKAGRDGILLHHQKIEKRTGGKKE